MREHLGILHQYGDKIAHAATAKDVDIAMRQITDSQMALSQEGYDKVVAVHLSLIHISEPTRPY